MFCTSASVAVCAAAGLVGFAGSLPASATTSTTVRQFAGPLSDLQPGVVGPFDAASARLVKVEHTSSSTFVLTLRGVARTAAGQTFGAHLHTGPCVAGNPAAAGPHYSASAAAGDVPPLVSDRTEVWLDVTVQPGGHATAVAQVPFVVPPGTRSVVLHAQPTDDHGTAGPRQACLPVVWS